MSELPEASAKETSDAILISRAQTKLKDIIEEHVRTGKPIIETRRRCDAIVSSLLDALKNDDTREKTKEAMQTYIRELYARFTALYGALRGMSGILKREGVVKKLKSDGLPVGGIPLSKDPLSYNMSAAAQTDFNVYHREVKEELASILSADARPDYGDRNINLRLIAELNVRYETQLAMIDGLKESGEDLVWIEPHANCSARCEPWQGKLYSISGRTGKTAEGITYRPLRDATDVRVTTKSGRTYLNGCVTGFGCRHKLTPYRPGNKPVMIPAEVVERQRAAEEKQRALERSIRYQKEKAIALRAFDPEGAKEARMKARKLAQIYEGFSQAHGLPTVPTRTRVVEGENIYARNAK